MFSRTPKDLNLYPKFGKKKMKFVDAKYQVHVGCWARKTGSQDYNFYVIEICMFDDFF
jgi:hypothetical protein